jgi:hypothetical protein
MADDRARQRLLGRCRRRGMREAELGSRSAWHGRWDLLAAATKLRRAGRRTARSWLHPASQGTARLAREAETDDHPARQLAG